MYLIFQNNKLSLRLLDETDIPLLSRWLSDLKVLQYYEGRDNPFDEEKVKQVFFSKDPSIQMCIVVYENIEIGYLQYFKLDAESKSEYGYELNNEVIYGMDQFIGNINYWNRGIGSLLVSSMVSHLVSIHIAKKIVVDPQTWNIRAIKCYEKCGFKKIRLLPKHELHEGEYRDCFVMEYKLLS
ncbi:GNAT family N-acetyltransferase [Gottfriedia sp. NPDC056225]|uniref:GNAT family N-acetyltransferase n=1 Tax=Gottfriedia sp. NPDC056225 TaxID=3345751 RepID=UPI0035D9C083